MEDASINVVIGVISGVMTSALIALFVVVFNKVIAPWYRNLIYKGVVISGAWYWFDKDEDAVKMEVKQHAGKITGVYTYMNSANKGDIKIYSLDGSIRDRFVQINLESEDRKRLGAASYLFEVVGDGDELRGCSVFYSTNSHRVCADIEHFYRTLEMAKKALDDNEKICVNKSNIAVQPTAEGGD